jgi:hypothetical protein
LRDTHRPRQKPGLRLPTRSQLSEGRSSSIVVAEFPEGAERSYRVLDLCRFGDQYRELRDDDEAV